MSVPEKENVLNRQGLVGVIKTDFGKWDVIGWNRQSNHADFYDAFGPDENGERKTSTMKVALPGASDVFETELQVYKEIAKLDSASCFLKLRCIGNIRHLKLNYKDPDKDTTSLPFMVLEKLQISLADLRNMCPTLNFPVKLAIQLGLSCLEALRALHNCGFVHYHVNPENFMLRLGANKRLLTVESSVVLMEFGMAQRWPSSAETFQDLKYASPRVHRFYDAEPVDDLWSLLYIIMEWCLPSGLPWAHNDDIEEVYRLKKRALKRRLDNWPEELHQIQKELSETKDPKFSMEIFRYHLRAALKSRAAEPNPSWIVS